MADNYETRGPRRLRRVGFDHSNSYKIPQDILEDDPSEDADKFGHLVDASQCQYEEIPLESLYEKVGPRKRVMSMLEYVMYDESPQKLRSSLPDQATSYSSPPKRLFTREGAADRANGSSQNGQQFCKRKRGIFISNPSGLIDRLSQCEPDEDPNESNDTGIDVYKQSQPKVAAISRKQGFNLSNVQVVYLWPIFDVIFNHAELSQIHNYDTTVYDDKKPKDDNDDDDSDSDKGHRYDNEHHQHDDNKKHDKGENDRNYKDENFGDDFVGDNGGKNDNGLDDNDVNVDANGSDADDMDDCSNDEDYITDDNERDDSIDGDDDIDGHENDDEYLHDFDDTNYDADCDDMTNIEANDDETEIDGACHGNKVVHQEKNERLATKSRFITSGALLEDVGMFGSQTYNTFGDVNNNIDATQFDPKDQNLCQTKHSTGKNCCYGNQQHHNQSVGDIGGSCYSESESSGKNTLSSCNDMMKLEENLLDYEVCGFKNNNYIHVNQNGGVYICDPFENHQHQDTQETSVETELGSDLSTDLHGKATMGLNLNHVISQADAKTFKTKAARREEKVFGANCENQHQLESFSHTDIITTDNHSTSDSSNWNKVQKEAIDNANCTPHEPMADTENKNTQVSQLTIKVAPVVTTTRSSSNKYSTIFQPLKSPTGRDVSKKGVSSLKSSKTLSSKIGLGSTSEVSTPFYSNEITIQVSSDDLSESDGEENFMPSSDMERLRKVSMGDMRDFADLKVMTEKLKLDHRRPSLVAWKEKNLPKKVLAAKNGQDDLQDQKKGQGHDPTSRQSHEKRRKTTNKDEINEADQKRKLLNRKSLTPPTERAYLGNDLDGRPRSSSFKSPSAFSADYAATIASTRSLESLQNSGSSRRSEVCRTTNMLDISEGMKSSGRSGSKGMMSSSGSLPSIQEEKVDSSGAIPNEFERRKKVDDTIGWIKNELQDMRTLDCTLAKQLLRLREEINHFRLQRCYEQQKEMIEDAFDREHELAVEKKFDVADFDLPESLFSPELRQVGITKMNITSRRFSVF